MDNFNEWKKKYVIKVKYCKTIVTHQGNCAKPNVLKKEDTIIYENFPISYSDFNIFDEYGNPTSKGLTYSKFMKEEDSCSLKNKNCVHKSKYKIMSYSLEKNTIFEGLQSLCCDSNFTSFDQFKKAYKLGFKTAEEYHKYCKEQEEKKAQKLCNLFTTGKSSIPSVIHIK